MNRVSTFNVPESETRRIRCRVTGSPSPNVTWFKDSVMIQTGVVTTDATDGRNSMLTITVNTVDKLTFPTF